MRVLVTNDDGVKAPGIDVLVTALRKVANVDVTVVAPGTRTRAGRATASTPGLASIGTSKSTTASGYPAVAVNGSPADAVLWALGGGVKTAA